MIDVFSAARRLRNDIEIRLAHSGAGIFGYAAIGVLGSAVALAGCSGTVDSGDGPGNGESVATGGTGVTGGTGGTGVTGGSDGTGVTGGAGGSEATGGASGTPATGGAAAGCDVIDLPPGTLGELTDVEFADGHFVAVGLDDRLGVPSTSRGKAMIVTSEDGRHWTRQLEGQEGDLRDVAHGDGTWVAVGWHFYDGDGDCLYDATYSQTVLTSADGVSWTRAEAPPENRLEQVIWTGAEFLMIGSWEWDPTSVWSSPDGAKWTSRAAPEGLRRFAVGAHGIVNGRYTDVSFSSDSGVSWTTTTLPHEAWITGLWAEGDGFKGAAYYDCCAGEVAGGQTYYELSSPDGLSWEQTEVSLGTIVPTEVAHGNDGVSVGLANYGSRLARKSPDSEWSAVEYPNPEQNSISGLAFGAGVFVAVGNDLLLYSEDGVTWHEADSIE